jgi:hypothetical protein
MTRGMTRKTRGHALRLAGLVCLVSGCVHPGAVFVQTDKHFARHARKDAPVVLYDVDQLTSAKPFRTVGVLEIRRVEADSLNTFEATVEREGKAIGCDVLAQRDTYEMRTLVLAPPSDNYLGGAEHWHVNGFAAWQFYCGEWGAEEVDPGTARYTRKVATDAALTLRREGRGEVLCAHQAVGNTHIRRDVCTDAAGLDADSPR